jgi:hypothetical protein
MRHIANVVMVRVRESLFESEIGEPEISSLSDPRRECGPSPLFALVQVTKVRPVL